MQSLPTRVDSRMRTAAAVLTPKLRAHAINRGVPEELARKLLVVGDGHHFNAVVSDPAYQSALDDHEWGSTETTPKAHLRTFQSELDNAWNHVMSESLLDHVRAA